MIRERAMPARKRWPIHQIRTYPTSGRSLSLRGKTATDRGMWHTWPASAVTLTCSASSPRDEFKSSGPALAASRPPVAASRRRCSSRLTGTRHSAGPPLQPDRVAEDRRPPRRAARPRWNQYMFLRGLPRHGFPDIPRSSTRWTPVGVACCSRVRSRGELPSAP